MTADRARLLVWHRSNRRVTHAVTLVGDTARFTLDVIGPALAAWR